MHFNIPEDRASLRFPSLHAAQCFLGKLKSGTGWKFDSAADGMSCRVQTNADRLRITFEREGGKLIRMKLRNEAEGRKLHFEEWNEIMACANRYRA